MKIFGLLTLGSFLIMTTAQVNSTGSGNERIDRFTKLKKLLNSTVPSEEVQSTALYLDTGFETKDRTGLERFTPDAFVFDQENHEKAWARGGNYIGEASGEHYDLNTNQAVIKTAQIAVDERRSNSGHGLENNNVCLARLELVSETNPMPSIFAIGEVFHLCNVTSDYGDSSSPLTVGSINEYLKCVWIGPSYNIKDVAWDLDYWRKDIQMETLCNAFTINAGDSRQWGMNTLHKNI